MKKLSLIVAAPFAVLALGLMVLTPNEAVAAGVNTAQLSRLVGEATPSSGVRLDCPPNTIFGQTPHPPESPDWMSLTSDIGLSENYIVYDNFDNADGATGIRFWGMRAYFDVVWIDCDEDPMPFEIVFWTDNGGEPGTAIATYNLSLVGTWTGQLYGGYKLIEWNTDLVSAPPLSGAGWVSIQAGGDPGCWFLWMSSAGMDEMCYQWIGDLYYEWDSDVAFCLYADEPCDAIIGDANNSDDIDIDDVVYLIDYIFSGGLAPTPYAVASGDADCSCSVDIDDVVYLINYIFSGSPPPGTCEQWVALCGSLH
ncbi:MAG: hypothetical protein KAT85_11935 [candidate division Zixibacteria bacterium]|nr:hypothetical protein [candidate division Zixibacteria bacterium]